MQNLDIGFFKSRNRVEYEKNVLVGEKQCLLCFCSYLESFSLREMYATVNIYNFSLTFQLIILLGLYSAICQ